MTTNYGRLMARADDAFGTSELFGAAWRNEGGGRRIFRASKRQRIARGMTPKNAHHYATVDLYRIAVKLREIGYWWHDRAGYKMFA